MSLSVETLRGIKRGQLVIVDLRPALGDEMGKSARPAVVVSPDSYNERLTTITVVPCTTHAEHRNILMHEVALPASEGGLKNASIALPHHVRTIDSERVTEVCGFISPPKLKEITDKLLVAVGATRLG